ncbi:serine O-acetyltransferase [Chamaesiphon minutus]|uniref:Serine acetyltransferase n=1 Tax=Chamaesiphon minutus (strain ATCC 27169 / PCC 6605) TaxID=1173020 RepID=K9UCK1_CHAP6|nr:serine O-acetyltransferase [Chamaesiphon minutus]AFY92565.1 serine acetyltransferase [Chamaesiphon minutus PCC 6605]
MTTILPKLGQFGISETDQILANDRSSHSSTAPVPPKPPKPPLLRLDSPEPHRRIRQYVIELLKHNLLTQQVAELIRDRTVKKIVRRIEEDLAILMHRDPAAGDDPLEVWETYLSLRAVANYRIANALYTYKIGNLNLRAVARRISETTKVETGIEIHPGATIGRELVIDHGVGTVIGETTVIGDKCYLLQCIILGSTGIADNISGRRHPQLGDNVRVGGFVRVFGSIHIGDNVEISPWASIVEDIPANSRVVVKTINQVIKS